MALVRIGMTEQETTSHTFRNELLRSIPAGVLETLGSTFGMLVAVRVFAAGDLAKSTFLSATSGERTEVRCRIRQRVAQATRLSLSATR